MPGGPAFFTQKRVGRNGKLFTMYKFRSMTVSHSGSSISVAGEGRITPLGAVLRKYKLDELPELWNVLKGDMSLVGTRPPTKEEFENYDISHKVRLSMKPGITGLWQVSGRNKVTDFEQVVKLDTEYIENWGFYLDFYILCKTIQVVFTGDGSK